MTSLPTSGRRPVDHIVDSLIDRGGDAYGDEMERLRYYETHSALIQMQFVASFLVGIVALFLVQGRALDAVFWVVLAPQLLNVIGVAYLDGRGVRTKEVTRRSARRPIFWVTLGLYAAFIVVYLVQKFDGGDGTSPVWYGMSIGVFTGLAAGVVAIVGRNRAARRSPDDEPD